MEPTVVLRPRSARALCVGLECVAVIGLVSAVADGLDVLLVYAAPLLLLALLGWAAFWEPYVEVSDGEVVIRNTLRTVHVPWPSIQAVEGRYGLRLVTAYGAVTAWAAAAPGGRQRARLGESQAARLVTRRLEALREAGHLDDPRLESPTLRTTWHRALIAAVVVLVVASLTLPFLR